MTNDARLAGHWCLVNCWSLGFGHWSFRHFLTFANPTDTVPLLMLKHTPFYDFHVASGGRLVDFAGWEMPIVYRSIIDEHEQTRKSGSIFDVSHMGRLYFSGPDALKFLDKVVTRKIVDQKVGQCRYSLV